MRVNRRSAIDRLALGERFEEWVAAALIMSRA
jgi:hypothetical protein